MKRKILCTICMLGLLGAGCSRTEMMNSSTEVESLATTEQDAGTITQDGETIKASEEETSQNELPKYLTVEMVREVCDGLTYTEEDDWRRFVPEVAAILNSMVQIKGVDTGSGVASYRFFLNEEETKILLVTSADIEYYDSDTETTEYIYYFPMKKTEETDPYDAEEKDNLLTQSYEMADAGQKEELNKLTEAYGAHACHYERKIKVIMGEWPDDFPRMTLDQAREICHSVTYAEMDEKDKEMFDGGTQVLYEHLNETAGFPDYADSHTGTYSYELAEGYTLQVHLAAAIVYNAAGEEVEWLFPYPGMPAE